MANFRQNADENSHVWNCWLSWPSPLIKTIDSYGFIGASGKSIPELEVSTAIKLLYEQPIASSSSGIPNQEDESDREEQYTICHLYTQEGLGSWFLQTQLTPKRMLPWGGPVFST